MIVHQLNLSDGIKTKNLLLVKFISENKEWFFYSLNEPYITREGRTFINYDFNLLI